MIVVLCLAGCSDGKPRRVPVTGTVSYKGQLLTDGDVVFIPEDSSGGYRARGKVDPGGKFALTTFEKDDGAVPGTYKVTVFAYQSRDPKLDSSRIAPRAGTPAVPQKYFDQKTTDLTVKVEDSATALRLDL